MAVQPAHLAPIRSGRGEDKTPRAKLTAPGAAGPGRRGREEKDPQDLKNRLRKNSL